MSHSIPTAIVTGASRGIGRAIAAELAARGYAVVLNYLQRRDFAEQLASEIQAVGGRTAVCQCDVGLADDRRRLVDCSLENFGRLDVLVNNAGITSPGRLDLLDVTEDGWDRVFATNLKGPFFLAQQAALTMLPLIRDGRIPRGVLVNVSSISAYTVSENRADYCIAKSAMSMMTWLFASRLAQEGILAYEVCPGVIRSDMTAPVQEKYDRLIREGLSPIRRWGEPADVARAVALLAAGEFAFSTGERFNIDGGYHIRRL